MLRDYFLTFLPPRQNEIHRWLRVFPLLFQQVTKDFCPSISFAAIIPQVTEACRVFFSFRRLGRNFTSVAANFFAAKICERRLGNHPTAL